MKNIMLKRMALKAKNRLIGKSEGMQDFDDCHVTIIKELDDEFIEKVRTILNSETNIQNPLKLLMDNNAVLYMTPLEKERYLLSTLSKFKKAKELIEQEEKRAII